jgi:uncharacterized iron-regulated membrane protein
MQAPGAETPTSARDARLRRWALRIHLWSGVAISLWAVLIGLSGSVLVFKDEIEAALHPEIFLAATPQRNSSRLASLEAVAQAVRRQHPQHQLGGFRGLNLDGRSAYAWIFQTDSNGDLVQRRNVHFHPFSGELLGTVLRYEGFPGWLENLHFFLLMGRPGLKVNGVMGTLLLLMCVSGAVLWWPGWRRLRDGVRIQWRARWKRLNHDLHRVGGFAVAGLLALMAITGCYFGFHDAALGALRAAGGMDAASGVTMLHPPKVDGSFQPQAMEIAIASAQESATADGRMVAHLAVPRKSGAVIVVDSLYPGNPLTAPLVREFYHPSTGALLHRLESTTEPWGVRVSMAVAPIHFGQWGGGVSKCLWALLGLTPGLLAVSGILMWWNRVLRPRWMLLRRPPASTCPTPAGNAPTPAGNAPAPAGNAPAPAGNAPTPAGNAPAPAGNSHRRASP